MDIKILEPIKNYLKEFNSIDEFNNFYTLNKEELDKMTTHKLNKMYHIKGYRITKIKNVLMLKKWDETSNPQDNLLNTQKELSTTQDNLLNTQKDISNMRDELLNTQKEMKSLKNNTLNLNDEIKDINDDIKKIKLTIDNIIDFCNKL